MFCPSCSTQSAEGAKFCKACGMSLTAITQALSGGPSISDPLRDREYRRSRKQVSDGIQGAAVGLALLVVAGFCYFLFPIEKAALVTSLVLALGGLIKLFKSLGTMIDAKIGSKVVSPVHISKVTGSLNPTKAQALTQANLRSSNRISIDPSKFPQAPHIGSRIPGGEEPSAARLPDSPLGSTRAAPGRVNREHSSQLIKPDKDDLMSKLRN